MVKKAQAMRRAARKIPAKATENIEHASEVIQTEWCNVSSISAVCSSGPAHSSLSKGREAIHASSAPHDASPPRVGSGHGGKKRVFRHNVEVVLATELHGQQLKSKDLFGDVFHMLTPEKCGTILRKLAENVIVHVCRVSSTTPLIADKLDTPIKRAIGNAAECSEADNKTYQWLWNDLIHKKAGDNEENTVDLLNTISIAAYTASVAIDSQDGSVDPLPAPNTRFSCLPNRGKKLPACDEDDSESQDCRPDIIGLPSDAFCSNDSLNKQYLWKSKTHTNVFTLLQTDVAFKRLFGFCTEDFLSGRRPSGAAEGLCRKALIIRSFEEWYHDQEARDHLDLRYVCWSMVEGVGEVKHQDKAEAIVQELGYMHKQLRTQPWLRFAVGWFVTTTYLGIMRADPIGVEQCIVNRQSSRGALDTVRFALGFVVSTDEERGHHPAFTLERVDACSDVQVERKRDQPPVPPSESQTLRKRTRSSEPRTASSSTTAARKKAKTDETSGSTDDNERRGIHGVPDRGNLMYPDVQHFRHIRFITLANRARHYPKPDCLDTCTRYFVHHLVDNRRSISGRSARIFCVSREVTADDPEPDGEKQFSQYGDDYRKFIGVYALKLYYASHSSECYKDDLIDKARQRGITTTLLPVREWRVGSALEIIRHFEPGAIEDARRQQEANPEQDGLWPGIGSDRQEVFAQTDLKRTLAEFSSLLELVTATSDVVQAILDLSANSILHRDISKGNILLSKELENPQFFASASELLTVRLRQEDPERKAIFVQRTIKSDLGGLLHDFDMVGVRKDAPLGMQKGNLINRLGTQEHRQKAVFNKAALTGTPPYMAVNLLAGKMPHRLEYDLCSLFYVIFLLAVTVDEPLDMMRGVYPAVQKPHDDRPWDEPVLEWAYLSNQATDMKKLSNHKHGFFGDEDQFGDYFLQRGSKFWQGPNAGKLLLECLYYPTWPQSSADFRNELFSGGVKVGQDILAKLNLLARKLSEAH